MTRRARAASVGAVLVVATLLAGCSPTERGAVYTVLDIGDGAVLCEGGVRESWPPSCDGPSIVNWNWDAVEYEQQDDVRWGDYRLTVTPDDDHVSVALVVDPIEDGA